MSVAVHAADVVDDALRARRRDERLLACTLAASVLVHTAAVALAPGLRKPDTALPRPLQVVIVKPPVPLPVRAEPPPRPQPPPPVSRASAVRQQQPAPKPAPAPERKPVLALPESAPAAAPGFTVPPSVTAEPAPVEPRAIAAAPAASSAPAPAREVPVTPPVHDAAYLNNPKPRYPLIAHRNGVEGTVHLRVLVSREGRALQVQVDRSSGSSALDNSAVDAVRTWKFVPARRGPETVEQSVTFPVRFKIDNAS